MKDFSMFNFEFLFGDHFAKVSNKAKLLYIYMSFFANAGFVANPKQLCSSLKYDESVIDELISAEEILVLDGRSEVFLTSYYVHNPNFNPLNWTKTPYFSYWKGKLWMKKNRVATLSKSKAQKSLEDESVAIDPTLPDSAVKSPSPLDELPVVDDPATPTYDSTDMDDDELF